MGRTKIQLRKIENKMHRNISFSKRKSGLIKKAYELCVLCDIQIFVIIFSPAAKLFLYHGNSRVEETLKRLVDLPQQKRGRLNNVQLIREVIDKLTLETNIYRQFLMPSGQMVDAQLEETQNELWLCNSELEQLEKELSNYIKSLSSITTVKEAEDYESLLEDTLKHVQRRKQILESTDDFMPTAPQDAFNPNYMNVNMNMNMNTGGFFMGSPNFNLNLTPQPQMDFFGPRGFQHFSQAGQVFPDSIQGYYFSQPNIEINMNSYLPNIQFAQSADDPYLNPYSQSQFLQHPNFSFSPRINSGEGTSMQGEMGNMNSGGAMGYNGTTHLGPYGNPFPF